jgi:catechol 2,3-dioxygenase-like lactoylglutathione lyase family enzyme
MRYRHIALFVGDDLRGAEEYYCGLFEMQVAVREALVTNEPHKGQWGQLPLDATWDDAVAAGVDIGMVALERGDVTLPLFAAQPTGERFYAIGLVMEPEEITAVTDRMNGELIESRTDRWLAFVDRYGVRWQLSDSGPFLGAGTSRDVWLEV